MKFFVYEVVQWHALGDDVAPGITGGKCDVTFVLQCFEGFDLDESDVATWAGPLLSHSAWPEVAVAFETKIGDGMDFLNRVGGVTELRCNIVECTVPLSMSINLI
jgi:hypothetical protein